jgi:hypothetical protein
VLAKQSIEQPGRMDCFVACAPRNDGNRGTDHHYTASKRLTAMSRLVASEPHYVSLIRAM